MQPKYKFINIQSIYSRTTLSTLLHTHKINFQKILFNLIIHAISGAGSAPIIVKPALLSKYALIVQ